MQQGSEVAAVNAGLVAWLAAFTNTPVSGGAVFHDAIAAAAASASADDLAVVSRRLDAYFEELTAAAEASGEDLPEALVDSVAAAITSVEERIAALQSAPDLNLQ